MMRAKSFDLPAARRIMQKQVFAVESNGLSGAMPFFGVRMQNRSISRNKIDHGAPMPDRSPKPRTREKNPIFCELSPNKVGIFNLLNKIAAPEPRAVSRDIIPMATIQLDYRRSFAIGRWSHGTEALPGCPG